MILHLVADIVSEGSRVEQKGLERVDRPLVLRDLALSRMTLPWPCLLWCSYTLPSVATPFIFPDAVCRRS